MADLASPWPTVVRDPGARRAETLVGRRRERGELERLLAAIREGKSRALVVRGDTGVGKTALLQHLRAQADGCRIVRAAGVEAEMEFDYAGLHQLCGSMLDLRAGLPEPHRDALGVAFGLSGGPSPDRFFVGLAVLGLLSEVAADRPLLCLVDDAQWLDRTSMQALAFVARRLDAESVGIVFALRTPIEGAEPLGELPQLTLEGLPDRDARALLGAAVHGRLDQHVRDRIVAETRGNPLALLELPRALTPAELAGGFSLPDAPALQGRLEESFRRRTEHLPEQTQLLLLLVAAEPLGEPLLVWRAAERLGIPMEAAAPAIADGLVEFGARVRFRHPLVRSAVYRAAPAERRRRAHAALAEATDPALDPDRRAWHRAHATAGVDEAVAAELEGSAERARSRGGVAAAAAFLELATERTAHPARRATRALAAAEAKLQIGADDAALALLALARVGPLEASLAARIDVLEARIALGTQRRADAPRMLLAAARRLEPFDVARARDAYLDALYASLVVPAGPADVDALAIARAALAAPAAPEPVRADDLLLDGLALSVTDGYAAAVAMLRRALLVYAAEQPASPPGPNRGWFMCTIAAALWESDLQEALATGLLDAARDAGALATVPILIPQLAGLHMRNGDLEAAEELLEEMDAAYAAIERPANVSVRVALAAYRGREADALTQLDAIAEHPMGSSWGKMAAATATALLYNGLGRYEEALAAGWGAYLHPYPVGTSAWVLPEIVEAASRCGEDDAAQAAFDLLEAMTRASGTDWALGVQARCRALLTEGPAAEAHYIEAIDRLASSGSRVDHARAHLLYGEWLRRERRRVDARTHLRTAHDRFVPMGVEAFADRAARELVATGETARPRLVATADQLTAQEAQIARLARNGLSNPEIGSRLFISPRTVEYHLRKVFAKLDITSRRQLDEALAHDGATAQPA